VRTTLAVLLVSVSLAHAGLVGHWPLNGSANDSGGAYDGAFIGTETYATGAIGQAVSLDGSSYIDLGEAAMPANTYTKSAWIYRTADAANNILSGGSAHAFWCTSGGGNTSRLAAGHGGAWLTVQSDVAVPMDTWMHVAVTYDATLGGGTLQLYTNGVPVAGTNGTATGAASHGVTSARIGAYGTANNFRGLIDDVGLWDEALSDSEILAIYTAGVASNDITTLWMPPPPATLTDMPKPMQIYPRALPGNTATIPIAGTVDTNGYDKAVLTVYREGIPAMVDTQALVYAGSTAPFAFSPTITAELANYDFELAIVKGTNAVSIRRADNIAAGDVYIIQGQSNADANMYNGSANGNQHPFLRTYGMNSDSDATTTSNADWLQATGDGSRNKVGGVGQWGLRMGRLLIDTNQVPIAILNGAHGGRPISFFQRNDASREDLSTNYGRLLYRARLASVTNDVRSVLWYQGEAEGGDGAVHENGFIQLYQDWKEDYPNIERVYVHQLRVGCGVTKNSVDLRDRQRRLQDKFADISVTSTTGINGQDGCHYAYTNGYKLIGNHIAALVGRDLYGAPDLPNIEAPNIATVMFADTSREHIVIHTRNATDDLVFDSGAEADWLIQGDTATVVAGEATNNRITLTLSAPAPAATNVVYTGHQKSGPWVTNVLGVGLLTFSSHGFNAVTAPPVAAPSNLTGVAISSGRVRLTWSTVTNATTFAIRRDGAVVDTSPAASFTDSGLTPLTSYDYAVAAVNDLGTSGWSSVVSVQTLEAEPIPDTPVGFSATVRSSSAVALNWSASSNAAWYAVQRDGSVVQTLTGTNLIDTQLSPETRYDYAVAAANDSGTSAWSSVIAVTTTSVSVFVNVPEAADYELVYTLEIPNEGNFRDTTPVPYSLDRTANITGDFDRVAYYLELDDTWVYVSMDAFTTQAEHIGLPHTPDNPVFFQTYVSNLHVLASTGANVTTGTVATGNLEFWPNSYGPANEAGIPGASTEAFDFGDDRTEGTNPGYGSFQVHNTATGETILAYNRWGAGGESCVGIGNRTTGNPDWTFANNAATYTTKNLYMLVHPVEEVVIVRGASNNVSEAADYQLVYSLDISNSPAYLDGVTYTEDRSAAVSNFVRVAYYLELQPTNGDLNYVWASMDRFTTNINQIGVPTLPSGAVFQQLVTNLTVVSSDANIVTGTNMTGGNIEFWPRNYGGANAKGVPNATAAYDFGDTMSAGGNYGSMQVHNHEARQVLLAFNRWGGGGGTPGCLGIGNRPGSANIDWTHADNAGDFAVKTLQVYIKPLTPGEAPELLAVTPVDLQTVTLVFSRPIDNNATNVANYALNGGLTVLSATIEPIARTGVTLTTSPQSSLTGYEVTVNNVRNLSSDHTPIAPDSTMAFTSTTGGSVFENVPDIGDWQLVYSLNIPDRPNYQQFLQYDVDAHVFATNFSRIGYYMQLKQPNQRLEYVWATLDPFTNDAAQIGVPTVASGAFFQRPISNLTVYASVTNIVAGTNMTGGNIEFWPSNYSSSNSAAVPNADDVAYDFGDIPTPGNYGSMQLHNHEAQQTLFAFNRWGGPDRIADIGIGSRAGNENTDWTFAQNAAGYEVKTLQVFVLPPDNSAQPAIADAWADNSFSTVFVAFSRPLEDEAADVSNFTLDGGATVLDSTLDAASKAKMILTTSSLTPGTLYTVTVNGVRDRTDAHAEIAPDSTATFRTPYVSGVFNNVPEAEDYTLIYTLPIPNRANFRGSNAIPYSVDDAAKIVKGYDRVAYYMELETEAGLQWVYASMDDFANGVTRQLGIPHSSHNVVMHQQIIHNMNVYASADSGIMTGTGLATGNIEMWPSNYGRQNSLGIPNASGTLYDWGDGGGGLGAGHGSFQVHNHGAELSDGTTGQVLFAYNDWGGNNANGNSELGIGNNPGEHPDWTVQDSAHLYTVKNLQILVRETEDAQHPVDVVREKTGLTLENYEIVYDLDIPEGPVYFNTRQIPYQVNRSDAFLPGLSRIAYFMDLERGGTTDWVFVSMDAFTPFAHQTGVPSKGTDGNGAITFQQIVTNMDIHASSGANITTGTGIQTGNIEFFPSNYQPANSNGIPNASGSTFDFGDNPTPGDHGCMQVHNHDSDGDGPGTNGETLLAYNHWGSSGTQSAVGIGNSPGGHPDWTHEDNADQYSYRNMKVLVLPGVYGNVPEAREFRVVYALDIPNEAITRFNHNSVPYAIDNSSVLAGKPFNRIAYYLELKKPGEDTKWAYISMDAFTEDLSKIGVPVHATGVRWQMGLSGMNILASANSGVATETGVSTGSIEFWPNNYGTANEVGVPGANGDTFDFGDDVNETVPQGHGSMQIHNHGVGEVVLAYNGWGSGGIIGSVGIGNQPTGQPDWTFADNADEYEVKTLLVLASLQREGMLILVR
jgi:hypothetical protein